jgi:hypothetical protein
MSSKQVARFESYFYGRERKCALFKREGMFCAAINFDDKDQILNGVVTDL